MNNTKRLKNRSGFSLVELLVAIAIFSVIMTVVFSFMRSVNIQYGKGNTEINLQNEVQSLMAHLQDFIVNANASVGVSKDDNNIKLFMIIDKDGLDNDEFRVIEFDDARGCLYYYSSDVFAGKEGMDSFKKETDKVKKFDEAKKIVTNNPIAYSSDKVNTYLLTEDVTWFSVNTKNITDNYIVIGVTIEKNNSHYTAQKNIYLRNSLYEVGSNGSKTTTEGEYYEGRAATASAGEEVGGSEGEAGTPTSETTAGVTVPEEGTTPVVEKVVITSCNITICYEGDAFNPGDVDIHVTYSDGSDKDTITRTIGQSYKDEENGKFCFKVDYQGVTSDNYFPVNYALATGAIVSLKYPSKVYYQGDTLSASDFTVQYVYSDGHKRDASFGFNSGTNKLNDIGVNTVSINTTSAGMSKQFTETCPVNAIEKPSTAVTVGCVSTTKVTSGAGVYDIYVDGNGDTYILAGESPNNRCECTIKHSGDDYILTVGDGGDGAKQYTFGNMGAPFPDLWKTERVYVLTDEQKEWLKNNMGIILV